MSGDRKVPAQNIGDNTCAHHQIDYRKAFNAEICLKSLTVNKACPRKLVIYRVYKTNRVKVDILCSSNTTVQVANRNTNSKMTVTQGCRSKVQYRCNCAGLKLQKQF
ncbi:hypothetical protein CISIN_1g034009mg [Citrus sinensis]|uniref:Uncharacterized protein n=1 Tax=Citrus sinensis TaxID=2711 RepID=A0A067D8Z2_CITSI|nr:hypothetical protein CISIN_1g034009mg [Citrus sinensis]